MAKELVVGDFYQPNLSQKAFHSSKAKYPLMHGTRGGGKTLAHLWEFLRACHEVPGSNNLLLRRTLTASEKGGIEDHLVKYIPKGMYTDYNKTKHIVTVHPKQGGESKLFFGHIKAEVDLTQYQGPEYTRIGWEELTQFTYPMWSYMKGSNRCPVPADIYGRKPMARMSGGTNPNGIGSHWVKALWIQHKLPSGVEDATYNPADYEAIFSSYEHNSVYANDAEYINNLASLPPNLRAAWLEGSWDILSGQFFSNWDLERHVRPAAEIAIPDWQPRWIGIDWGFNHATSVLWFAQAEVRDPLSGKQRKTICCYRELVRRGINEQALAAEILKANNGDKISNVFLSPERFNRINEDHTIADRMGDVLVGGGLPRPERANNDRVGGWRLVYTLLDTEGFLVSENCRDLIESFPQLMRDEKDLEDAAAAGNELYLDVMESCRYGLMSYFNPRKKPQHIVDDEVIHAIPDNTWKMMEHLRQQARPSVNELAINMPARTAPWRRN
jgi:Terminase large subunit, T4likevirus-type, N-terminal